MVLGNSIEETIETTVASPCTEVDENFTLSDERRFLAKVNPLYLSSTLIDRPNDRLTDWCLTARQYAGDVYSHMAGDHQQNQNAIRKQLSSCVQLRCLPVDAKSSIAAEHE